MSVLLNEYATNRNSSVFIYVSDCANYQYIKNLHCICNNSFDMYMYDKYYIQENPNIIDCAKNWNTLLTKQELHIKLKKSVLKKGLKATKDLQLLT